MRSDDRSLVVGSDQTRFETREEEIKALDDGGDCLGGNEGVWDVEPSGEVVEHDSEMEEKFVKV